MSKCLVLGANGFIGSHLVDALVSGGHEVRAFDRGQSSPKYLPNSNIEPYTGDFLNRDDIESAVRGMEYVFHFISTTTPATAENDPLIDVETNIKMSIVLFDECAKQKVKKVIFASTGGAIYGSVSDGKPISELTLPMPISPYAIGKLSIEHYLHYFHRKFGMDSLIYRISNPYGERQPKNRKQGVIPIFMQRLNDNLPINVLGDGSMTRDYMYVKDAAQLICQTFEKQTKHTLYNLGSGQGTSVNELIGLLKKTTGVDPEVEHKPMPPTYVQDVVLDTQRFREEFGVEPPTSLEDGMLATWADIRQYNKTES